MPTPGRAVSLAITVKLLRPCRTNSAIIRCGLPTPKNPPIMTEAPSGIFSTASDKAIALCICLVRSEAARVILTECSITVLTYVNLNSSAIRHLEIQDRRFPWAARNYTLFWAGALLRDRYANLASYRI